MQVSEFDTESAKGRWVCIPKQMFPDEAKEDTFGWRGQIKSAKKVSGKMRFQVTMKGFSSTWFTEQAVVKEFQFISD